MSALPGLNRPVPNTTSLLSHGDDKNLAFDSTTWKHLNGYFSEIAALAPELQDSSATTEAAMARVRSLADNFGSPKQIRQGGEDQANDLAEGESPASLYAKVESAVQQLNRFASAAVETLRSFTSSAKSGDARRADLRQLGRDAETTRQIIGHLAAELKGFKPAIIKANSGLSEAYRNDSDTLQRSQEQLGSLQVRIASLQKQVSQLGFFSGGKKHELERQLEMLEQEQQLISGRAERLRTVLAAIEPIQNEGFWLEPGIDELAAFFDRLRQVLTAFGCGVTQLAADASDAELEDAAGVRASVGSDASIQQWQAIAEASARFLAQSTAD